MISKNKRSEESQERKLETFNYIKKIVIGDNEREIVFRILIIIAIGILYFINENSIDTGMCFDNENSYYLEGDWQLSYEDERGKTHEEIVQLPHNAKTAAGIPVTYTKKLSIVDDGSDYFLIRSSQQYIKVYLDEELLLDYGNQMDVPFKIEPFSAWHLIKLPDDWNNKTIKIVSTSNYENYSGMLLQTHIGTKSALVYMIARNAIKTVAICFTVFLVGFSLMMTVFLFRDKQTRKKLFFLGLFSINISCWIMLESKLTQLFCGKQLLLYCLNFLLFSFIPITLLNYLLNCKSFRNSLYLKWNYFYSVVAFFCVHILQFTGILNYLRTYAFIQISIIITILGLIGNYIKMKINHEKIIERDVYLASFVFACFAIGDMIRVYFFPSDNEIYFSKAGILCFVTILGYFALKKAYVEQKLVTEQEIWKSLAYTDALTGLKNRRKFEEELKKYRNQFEGIYPFILFADLNDLKKINDGWGHDVGDYAITIVSKLITKSFKENANCFRIGGDEFCIVSTAYSMGAFLKEIHDFLQEVENIGKCLEFPLSVATGYCQMKENGIDEAVKEADRKMYENKRKMKISNNISKM
ncbi:MAG: GGDEF domain-containing protein [Lachnospiraceae bacterium]|nr:GGDEF domain-containing protein [Lachnospiraceae bacterium]